MFRRAQDVDPEPLRRGGNEGATMGVTTKRALGTPIGEAGFPVDMGARDPLRLDADLVELARQPLPLWTYAAQLGVCGSERRRQANESRCEQGACPFQYRLLRHMAADYGTSDSPAKETEKSLGLAAIGENPCRNDQRSVVVIGKPYVKKAAGVLDLGQIEENAGLLFVRGGMSENMPALVDTKRRLAGRGDPLDHAPGETLGAA